MERITPDLCTALWTHASELEFGLAIETDNPRELQRILYAVRKNHPNIAWSGIVVCMMDKPAEVWLMKKTAEEALL